MSATVASHTTGPGGTLAAIRARGPLIHNITNLVAMDLTANLLLAVGASPVMAHAREEVEEFVSLAAGLTINTGTLTREWLASALAAAAQATGIGRPWVLDPVGCGATRFRLESARQLARSGPSIIRGNASEIAALAGATAGQAGGRGVDSTLSADAVLEQARQLARSSGAIVAATGQVDIVTDGAQIRRVSNGHPLLTRVTAAGCALTALTGAAVAVSSEPLKAAVHALAIMGVAGERAAAKAQGPGSFRSALLDELYGLDPQELDKEARIT